jgi:hypothetical protein
MTNTNVNISVGVGNGKSNKYVNYLLSVKALPEGVRVG